MELPLKALLATFLFALPIQAQVFFHESFNNLPLGQLNSNQRTWEGSGLNNQHFSIVETSPSFSYQVKNGELISGGPKALQLTTNPEPTTNSSISYSFPAVGTDFYMSFLCRIPEIGTGSDTFDIELMVDENIAAIFKIRPYNTPGVPLLYGNSNGLRGSREHDNDHIFLFVLSFEGNSKLYYEDPNAANPFRTKASSGGSYRAPQVNGVRMSVNSSDTAGPSTTLLIDEFRLSYTLADSYSGIISKPTFAGISIHKAIEITWNSDIGKSYQVQHSTDLETWTDYGDVIQGDGSTLSIFDRTISNEKRFYRVEEIK